MWFFFPVVIESTFNLGRTYLKWPRPYGWTIQAKTGAFSGGGCRSLMRPLERLNGGDGIGNGPSSLRFHAGEWPETSLEVGKQVGCVEGLLCQFTWQLCPGSFLASPEYLLPHLRRMISSVGGAFSLLSSLFSLDKFSSLSFRFQKYWYSHTKKPKKSRYELGGLL